MGRFWKRAIIINLTALTLTPFKQTSKIKSKTNKNEIVRFNMLLVFSGYVAQLTIISAPAWSIWFTSHPQKKINEGQTCTQQSTVAKRCHKTDNSKLLPCEDIFRKYQKITKYPKSFWNWIGAVFILETAAIGMHNYATKPELPHPKYE